MGSDGSNPRRLTTTGGIYPSWSPDGRHLAFVSYRDGNWEIYVMELRQEGSGGTPLDDGDSPATALPLAVGASIEGELSADDSDYFRVTVSNAGTLMASTTGSTDTYGSIEDSSGNVLNENDDDGEDRNFRVSAAVEPGTYYIRVRGFECFHHWHLHADASDGRRFGRYWWGLGRRGHTHTPPDDQPLGCGPSSVLVSGWPPHRLPVLPRLEPNGHYKIRYFRDRFGWHQLSSPD